LGYFGNDELHLKKVDAGRQVTIWDDTGNIEGLVRGWKELANVERRLRLSEINENIERLGWN
jgi:hypothetical protein